MHAIDEKLDREGCWEHGERVGRQRRQGSGESLGGTSREVWVEAGKRVALGWVQTKRSV